MSAEPLRDLVARLATEPALGRALEADPRAFAREHRLSDDEVATLRSLRRPGSAGEGPQALRARLSRSGLVFGGALGALASDIDVEASGVDDQPAAAAEPVIDPTEVSLLDEPFDAPVGEDRTEAPVVEGSTGTSVSGPQPAVDEPAGVSAEDAYTSLLDVEAPDQQPVGTAGPYGMGPHGTAAPDGMDPYGMALPPGTRVDELPRGGQLIRFPDGTTATATPNPDGTVHVVERGVSGQVVDEYDAPGPVDEDEPVSLLDAGAAAPGAAGVSAVAAAEIVRRRRIGRG